MPADRTSRRSPSVVRARVRVRNLRNEKRNVETSRVLALFVLAGRRCALCGFCPTGSLRCISDLRSASSPIPRTKQRNTPSTAPPSPRSAMCTCLPTWAGNGIRTGNDPRFLSYYEMSSKFPSKNHSGGCEVGMAMSSAGSAVEVVVGGGASSLLSSSICWSIVASWRRPRRSGPTRSWERPFPELDSLSLSGERRVR